jgi:hypothetical protein
MTDTSVSQPRWTRSSIIGLSIVAVGLCAVSLVIYLIHEEPLLALRSAVVPGTIPSGLVLFSHSDQGALQGHDMTVLLATENCINEGCLSRSAQVLRKCSEYSTCVPPWRPISALPRGTLVAPADGYPDEIKTRIDALRASTDTVCTSLGTPYDSRDGLMTLCISPDLQLLLFRSARP